MKCINNNWLVISLLVLVVVWVSHSEYIPPGPRYECPRTSLQQRLLYPCNCTKGSDIGLYVTCEKTNLASLSVGLSNLAAISFPVEELIISSCNFGHIYGDLLYPVKVRILKIVNTPISTIDPLTFLGINKTLQELHIVNTSLEHFPKEAFNNLGNLTTLIIDGHNIQKLDKNAFSSSSLQGQLQKLVIINGHLADIPVETLTVFRKLKRLDFHNNSIPALKKGQFKGLRDVEFLDLSMNKLTKVDGTHMSDLTKLGWCNLSHNALSEITRGAFARNTILRSLNLSANKLRKLDSNSFKGMRLIRRLYLSDNNITDVGRGTFDGLSRIGTIDLARNQLKKIDFQMFNKLQYVELIDVSSNQVASISKHGFKELFLVHIDLSHNVISKIESNAFEFCANMTTLDMSYNKITSFPNNAFDDKTYATEFQVSYNLLTDLSQIPLANQTGLKVLNVSHNLITTIPRNTFPKLYELHTIDMSYNNLSSIAVTVFQTLFSLRTLLFQHNSLQEIKSATFGTLPTLIHLDLSFNILSDIGKQAFTRMSSLRTLNLSNNQLEEIFDAPLSLAHIDLSFNSISFTTPYKWPSMNSLLSINLSHNILEDNLVMESFTPLLTVSSLDLSFNEISIPPKEALSTLVSLQRLNLENNEISLLEKSSFGVLPIMSELNLARNKIATVNDFAFVGLKQLTMLDLSDNNISHIPNYAFKDLVALRLLDLSHNQVESLDNTTNSIFEELLSLENLNLRDNKISFLTRKSFPSNQWVPYHLYHLDLSYNKIPVLTYEMTFGTKTLRSLNLSHNLIFEIRKSVLGNLTSLQVLDLSNNVLDDLTGANVFLLPKSLVHLSLADNTLHTFPTEPILKTPSLKHLDLRNNELESFYNELMPRIKNGTEIYYAGNPISCDCYLRPVRRWALSLLEEDKAWSQFVCEESEEAANLTLLSVPETLLACNTSDTEDIDLAAEFQLTPDVKFREVTFMKERGVRVVWFVNSKQDIADFNLIVRDHGSEATIGTGLYWQRMEPYNIRSNTYFTIPQNKEGLELCIEAMTSEGKILPPISSQCYPLPVVNTGSLSMSPSLCLVAAVIAVNVVSHIFKHLDKF